MTFSRLKGARSSDNRMNGQFAEMLPSCRHRCCWLSQYLLVATRESCKTDEPIIMPYGRRHTRAVPRNHALDEGSDHPTKGAF